MIWNHLDMREAYYWRSNDAYKNSRSSRIEKNGWETSHFPLRFSMTRFFADTFPWSLNSAGGDASSLPTKDKHQIHVEIKENLLKESVVL